MRDSKNWAIFFLDVNGDDYQKEIIINLCEICKGSKPDMCE